MPEPYKKLAAEKYASQVSYEFSPNEHYVLCINSRDPSRPALTPPLNFFIYDLRSDEIVYEASLANGTVEWLNDTQIVVKTLPGIVPKESVEQKQTLPYGFIYDLVQQIEIPIESKKP